jgi:hypothetical protein
MDHLARQFIEKGKKLIESHSDFNDTLQDAHDYGMTISAPACAEIVRLGAPEVAYWLAKPENFGAAHGLMNMEPHQQVIQIQRYAKQLQESGFANDPDTEDYIDTRRQAKREGKRR